MMVLEIMRSYGPNPANHTQKRLGSEGEDGSLLNNDLADHASTYTAQAAWGKHKQVSGSLITHRRTSPPVLKQPCACDFCERWFRWC
jgi:hypothetical protein